MKILAIGDMHFKDNQSYADYIADGRVSEKKEALDFIIDSAKDCDHVVLLGDNFNSKNNSSETNRAFVEFVERLGTKETYIISGNHEKKGNGKTAIDFLGEIHRSNWHIFTRPSTVTVGKTKLDFLPFMLASELGVETSEEASTTMVGGLDGGDILFAHHAITGTTCMGMKVEMFREPVLSASELEKKYKLVVAGHIHESQQVGKILLTGSVFTSEVGETEKQIWKIETDDMTVEKLVVPQRGIVKLTDPTEEELDDLPANWIVKAVITKKGTDMEKLEFLLARFSASLVVEDYPDDRKKIKLEKDQAFDFSIEALLKLYSEAKGVELEKLLSGLQLIK